MFMRKFKDTFRQLCPRLYMLLRKSWYVLKDEFIVFTGVLKKRDFQDAKYVVLRRVGGTRNGIFSNLLVWLPVLRSCEENNKRVVVDLINCDNPYHEPGDDSSNPWEYYYEQPDCENGISLNEILSSAAGSYVYSDNPYVLRLNKKHPLPFPWEAMFTYDKNEILSWHQVYNKYIKNTADMRDKIDAEWERICLIKGGKKVLGVKFRGSDYRPQYLGMDHPRQATASEMVEYCKEFMAQHGEEYEYIYLAVDEEESLSLFKDVFKEKLLYYDCPLISGYSDNDNIELGAAGALSKLSSPRKAGEDYIMTVEMLSKCDSMLASCNSGSILSVIMNGAKYENIYMVDKGVRRFGEGGKFFPEVNQV